MKTMIASVKGARDFYPEDMAGRQWLYERLRRVSLRFGYEEYDGPFLEKLDLYAAKSGEELVHEQSFCFEDRGGEMITLRPELTPSLARMVAQRQSELTFPLRWWSFGPFWRYEKPQRGRTREFFQWNVDMIGVNSPEADAELLGLAAEFLREVGLKPEQVIIRVNNRRLMDAQFAGLGIEPEMRPAVLKLIDRREKMNATAWDAYAMEVGLSGAQLEGVKGLLADGDLWQQSDDLRRVFAVLDAMGLRAYFRYDANIIRGLEYYTGTVFEAFDVQESRAVLGGGHYDNLVADVGGEPLAGVGFAMGDVVITLVLKKYGLLPERWPGVADVLVTLFDVERSAAAFGFAMQLRRAGLKVVVYPEVAKLPKQFKFADRVGVRFVAILGPDEVAAGKVTLKDLIAHEQETLTQEQGIAFVQSRL
jgi:histidyl-tRNA synthetase